MTALASGPLTHRQLMVAAALGSAGLLAGAFVFQALGYAPCKLCLWQRYPHGLAAALGFVALFLPLSLIAVLGALAALSSAGVGLYHVGVEQGWWEGPTSCSGGDIGTLSADALLSQIMEAPLVRCDEIAWSLAGISMAGWNAILSVLLAALWSAAAIRQASSSASQ